MKYFKEVQGDTITSKGFVSDDSIVFNENQIEIAEAEYNSIIFEVQPQEQEQPKTLEQLQSELNLLLAEAQAKMQEINNYTNGEV